MKGEREGRERRDGRMCRRGRKIVGECDKEWTEGWLMIGRRGRERVKDV